MLDVQISFDPALKILIDRHPKISSVVAREGEPAIAWAEGDRHRSVFVDRVEASLKGIVELSDNNPLVCADSFSVPGPAATLAVLALGPLARSEEHTSE